MRARITLSLHHSNSLLQALQLFNPGGQVPSTSALMPYDAFETVPFQVQ